MGRIFSIRHITIVHSQINLPRELNLSIVVQNLVCNLKTLIQILLFVSVPQPKY